MNMILTWIIVVVFLSAAWNLYCWWDDRRIARIIAEEEKRTGRKYW